MRTAEDRIDRVGRAATEDDDCRAGREDGVGGEAMANGVGGAREGACLELVSAEIEIARG